MPSELGARIRSAFEDPSLNLLTWVKYRFQSIYKNDLASGVFDNNLQQMLYIA